MVDFRVNEGLTRLPRAPADRLTRPLMRFLRVEAVAAAALLTCTLLALTLANTPWSEAFLALWDIPAGITLGRFEHTRSLRHWINDGLMTLFFFLIALELKRELVLGELRDRRKMVLPLAAALGGMLVPASVFLLLAGGTAGGGGWGTVMSTDTAFVVGCLAVLGSRIPRSLRLFLLSLAIFDDIGAILVVAIGYGETLNWIALCAVGLGLAAVVLIARLGVRSLLLYFAGGWAIWLALDASGIHATLAGVILGLMTPARSWVSDRRLRGIFGRVIAHPPVDDWSSDKAARGDLRQAGVAAREALSPIERLEFALHPWVALLVMPLFALANAGVPIGAASFDRALTPAIFLAFLLGKPVGVALFSFLAVKMGTTRLPRSLPWKLLVAGSLLTGIGFTMALFIAELAFEPALLSAVKPAIMAASALSALVGLLALAWFTSARHRASALQAI